MVIFSRKVITKHKASRCKGGGELKLTQVKNNTPPKRRIAKRSLTTKNISGLDYLGYPWKSGYSPFD